MSARNLVQPKPRIEWTKIDDPTVVYEKLQQLTSTTQVLAKEGYVFEPLTEPEIWKKMRCQNCGIRLKTYRPPIGSDYYETQADTVTLEAEHGTESMEQGLTAEEEYAALVAEAARSTIRQKHKCIFHDGTTFKGIWQCCGGRSNVKGCCSELTHVACDLNEVRDEWVYHKTPNAVVAPVLTPSVLGTQSARGGRDSNRGSRGRYVNTHTKAKALPRTNANKNKDIRLVVALDCEMGTSVAGNAPLIRLSVVDFFTQQPLIDRLVKPTVPMAHYNTRFSGVTFAAMRNAVHSGDAIQGTDAARELLFNFIDANTILVMHGGSSDLTALRMLHSATRIIDTYVLEWWDRDVVEQGLKKSLKDVCMRRCGLSIQDAKLGTGRAAGHDSLEDALGTREIVCAWLRAMLNSQTQQKAVSFSLLAAQSYNHDGTDAIDRRFENTMLLEEMEERIKQELAKEEELEELRQCLYPDLHNTTRT